VRVSIVSAKGNEDTYKPDSGLEVKALEIGATTARTSPIMRRCFPFMNSRSFPVPRETIKPIAPIGKKRRAVSPAESLSTSCAIKTI
jgi:hypothetical protein